jgi:AcrR family transcriptional regulator
MEPAGAARAGRAERERERWRERAREVQQARLLDAVAELAAERGLRGASIARVASRAGVSRGQVADRFESVDACFLALLDWMLERATTLIAGAFERESTWSDGVLAGLEALLVFLDREPVRARASLLGSVAVPPSALQGHAQALGQLGRLVDARARRNLSRERQPPAAMSEATIGSVLGLLRRRSIAGQAPPFVPLLDQLVEVVVAPYLGPSAAAQAAGRGRERAEALLAQPAGPSRGRIELPSLLRHGNAHRVRACMSFLAAHPDASNRAIGAGIGVSHGGQVSALLARLRDAGLVEKETGGAGRSNAWRLSPYGAEVARALER